MRIIAHLDMDAFFAAVEERDNPQFKGMPIAVGAEPGQGRGRGVVSTANYKARECGIHSALPISTAWWLSENARMAGKPAVIFLPVDIEKYAAVSGKIMDIVRKYSPKVEEASIDEAYFDMSFTGSFAKAGEICQKIKSEIREKEKLTCSIGIGPNKLIAKIASGVKKPDGLTIVEEKDKENFLAPLAIRKIPGIGPKTEEMFKNKGVNIVRDLKKFSREQLEKMLGKWGLELYEKVRGRDDSPIVEEYEAKSIGEQETFLKDTKDSNFIFGRLNLMCKSIIGRLAAAGFKSFRTVVVTVRFADFQTQTRSHTLAKPTAMQKILEFEALKLLSPFLDKRENPKGKLIRLIGVRVEKLDNT